jgi:hypothetical protein
MLKKKDLMIFSCPNRCDFDIAMMQEDRNTIDNDHLNYLNIDLISRLLKRTGYDTYEISSPVKLDAELVKNFSLQKKNTNELIDHRISWLKKTLKKNCKFYKNRLYKINYHLICLWLLKKNKKSFNI